MQDQSHVCSVATGRAWAVCTTRADWREHQNKQARKPEQACMHTIRAHSASGALPAQRLRRLLFDAVAPGTVQWAKKLVRIDGMADSAADGAQSLDTLFLDWPEALSAEPCSVAVSGADAAALGSAADRSYRFGRSRRSAHALV